MKGTDEPGCKGSKSQKPNREESYEEASFIVEGRFCVKDRIDGCRLFSFAQMWSPH
jgi:hypothetical protein